MLLLGLVACGSASSASDASSRAAGPSSPAAATCGPPGAQILAESHSARVYVSHGEVYGCATGHAHSYRLGSSARSIRENRAGPVAVGGSNAGYAMTTYGVDTVSSQVVVEDLADGRRLRALPASTKVMPESFQSVGSIVVKPDGAVAWISQVSSVIAHGAAVRQVWRADGRGNALLDSGRSIAADSLRLSGSRLSWRDASRTRSSTLR